MRVSTYLSKLLHQNEIIDSPPAKKLKHQALLLQLSVATACRRKSILGAN